jgi:hypothetical protein
MKDRRKSRRGSGERRHPLSRSAKLRPSGTTAEPRAHSREPEGQRERVTVQLSHDALDRLRNAVYWTPGLTITSFVELCITESVDRMERKRGAEFPHRAAALRPGRRPK